MPEFVVPPPLDRGDRVAVVAPSSGLGAAHPGVYQLSLARLRDFDLEPVEFPTATRSADYRYDHPAERADDVERAFFDPAIGPVVAVIGGNDQLSLVEYLDTGVLRTHPTRFLGLSDNTVLHAALAAEGVSFYGGHLLTDFAGPDGVHDDARDHLERAFFGEPTGPLLPAPGFTDDNPDWAGTTTARSSGSGSPIPDGTGGAPGSAPSAAPGAAAWRWSTSCSRPTGSCPRGASLSCSVSRPPRSSPARGSSAGPSWGSASGACSAGPRRCWSAGRWPALTASSARRTSAGPTGSASTTRSPRSLQRTGPTRRSSAGSTSVTPRRRRRRPSASGAVDPGAKTIEFG